MLRSNPEKRAEINPGGELASSQDIYSRSEGRDLIGIDKKAPVADG